jgi:hypothetical protein
VVITNAAAGYPNAKGLAYVDAYMPDEGEPMKHMTDTQPGSALALSRVWR